MADKQLVLDLIARDKGGPGTKSFAKGLDDVGDSAKSSTRHLDKLDNEIENVEKELHGLARAWVEAGDAAERADLSKTIRSTQRELRELQKNKGILSKILPGGADTDNAGKNFAKQLAGSIGGGLTSISGTLGKSVGPTVGGAIGIAAAPVLASTLGTALSAGSGLGVIGVGILAAVKGDTAIQNAGKAAGAKFMTGLQAEAKVLRGPVLESIDILSAAGDRLNKNLGSTFAELSDDITPFVRKVVMAGEAIEGSLLSAAKKSGPALEGAGKSVTLLSDGIGDFIDNVADGGPEAAANLELIAGATADVVAWSGKLIGTLNELSGNSLLTGGFLPLIRDYYDAKGGAEAATAVTKTLDGVQKHLAGTIAGTSAAARDQVDAFTELANQLKAETDPVFGMLRAQDQLTEAQKNVNEAQKEHGKKSPEYQEALRKSAEAALGLESAAGKVASTSSGKLGPALEATLRQAGFTDAQIKDLGKQFAVAKQKGDAFAKNYKATITASTAGAIAAMSRAKKLYDAFRSKKITVSVYVSQTVANKVNRQLGEGAFRAAGGPVKKGSAYVVGDGGRPEVFVPDRDGKIIPSIDQFNRGGSGGSAGGGMTTVMPIPRGAILDGDRLVEAISKVVRRRGGSVQLVLGGKNA